MHFCHNRQCSLGFCAGQTCAVVGYAPVHVVFGVVDCQVLACTGCNDKQHSKYALGIAVCISKAVLSVLNLLTAQTVLLVTTDKRGL